MAAPRATSLRRGIEILMALGNDEALERGGLGVVRIAELVGREKSQVSRALSALAESGLVDRDPDTRAYRLGWRLFGLAARSGQPRLVAAAAGFLTALVAETGETAHLSVLQGGQVLTLLSQAPPSAITATGWSGRTVPVVCTSSGRVLLFDHDLPALRALLDGTDFRRYGPRAPADLAELQRRIAAGRERGYAAVDEEFEPGLVGIAAPVRDIAGRIIAAVNVSGPKFRLESRFSVTGEAVRRAAAALSESVFGEPDAPAAPASVTV